MNLEERLNLSEPERLDKQKITHFIYYILQDAARLRPLVLLHLHLHARPHQAPRGSARTLGGLTSMKEGTKNIFYTIGIDFL